MSRLTIPSYPPQLANLDEWFDGVACLPNSVILDLAFLELKFGSWAMGQHPLQNALKLHFFPFSQRDVLEAFMGVSPSEKGTERLFRACIDGLWPELTEIPVNSYGDYRDYLVLLGKLTNPGSRQTLSPRSTGEEDAELAGLGRSGVSRLRREPSPSSTAATTCAAARSQLNHDNTSSRSAAQRW